MRPEPFGSYTLLRPLGKGGMAEVFLARATAVGGFEKLVAIKRLLPPFNLDEQVISMLADEARLSVWLTHPGIVQVLDFGKVGKTYYIAMEYVEGCDLCDLIRPDGRSPGRALPLPTALYIMLQVAEALDFAHRRCNSEGKRLGVIHRDVSPHNVLLSVEGQVKLADFGLARASISVHQSHAGVIRGKFSYMPKEQAHGRTIDHRIDLFAAGVTMYEALTGAKPYTSTTLAQQLYQLEHPIPPPSALIGNIPEEIDDLTLQAMSPDPDDRYQTAEELASDLRSALIKISSPAQEERQLTALVKNSLAARGVPPLIDRLPHMSIADLPVTDDNLIGEEVAAVQRTQGAPPELSPVLIDAPPPTEEIPDLSDGEEEDGETSQFDSRPRPDPDATREDLDLRQTVAVPSARAAGPGTRPASNPAARASTPAARASAPAARPASAPAARPASAPLHGPDTDLEGLALPDSGEMPTERRGDHLPVVSIDHREEEAAYAQTEIYEHPAVEEASAPTGQTRARGSRPSAGQAVAAGALPSPARPGPSKPRAASSPSLPKVVFSPSQAQVVSAPDGLDDPTGLDAVGPAGGSAPSDVASTPGPRADRPPPPVATDAFEIPAYDTLRDAEEAGRAAREVLDEARTVQRSPEEALAAFRRALEERERRKAQRKLRAVHWIGFGSGGVILFCLGVALGWFLRPSGPETPSTPITIRQECPEPPACPACPPPAPCPAPVRDGGAAATAPDGQAPAAAAPASAAPGGPAAAAPRTPGKRAPLPAPTADTRGMGFLALDADADAKAYIDERQFAAPVPMARLPLSPGIHRVRVLFLDTNTYSSTRWVTITAGKTTRVTFSQQE